ncbi:MAG: DoxX family protein [Paenibacillus sp.]|nr:DoxX family protein [Paenibacillus sp.]
MNIALWIVQALLGLVFLMAGVTKSFQYEKAKEKMPWAKEFSKGFVRFVGVSELLGAIGLILPYALGIVPVLTPIAAIGLALIMVLATVYHVRKNEYSAIGMNIVMLALFIFIAVGRW